MAKPFPNPLHQSAGSRRRSAGLAAPRPLTPPPRLTCQKATQGVTMYPDIPDFSDLRSPSERGADLNGMSGNHLTALKNYGRAFRFGPYCR
jgi:hypothetical protein